MRKLTLENIQRDALGCAFGRVVVGSRMRFAFHTSGVFGRQVSEGDLLKVVKRIYRKWQTDEVIKFGDSQFTTMSMNCQLPQDSPQEKKV